MGDVLVLFDVLVGQLHRKQRVEVPAETLFAAHHLHHFGYVLRHVQSIVPCVTFDESLAVGIQRVEVFPEMTVG